MRIGELAALVGVSPRTVRHYHHQGLLPEPRRRANGYREYGLRDAVRLARIRRLTALGLGLDEVRDVLADDTGTELGEMLRELDSDLRRQEEEIRTRRVRLAELLRQAEAGTLPEGAPLSRELAALFPQPAVGAPGHAPVSGIAAKDRDVLALLETSAPPGAREQAIALAGAVAAGEAGAERVRRAYALMDELADAAPDDPRVGQAAQAVAACVPEEVRDQIPADFADSGSSSAGVFETALYDDLPPAQAAALRQAVHLVTERAR
ncbi:MerR family transcriptional regulator [Streptomyces sp. PU-14G]|uniref:MerR family transcriptional regulator n=1 Tax=Streptomyces sp. PU-14G TaxID=2800808 RepID=UPI0034E03051